MALIDLPVKNCGSDCRGPQRETDARRAEYYWEPGQTRDEWAIMGRGKVPSLGGRDKLDVDILS